MFKMGSHHPFGHLKLNYDFFFKKAGSQIGNVQNMVENISIRATTLLHISL